MSKKSITAIIYTVPEKRIVTIDGKVVGFGPSSFRATEIAKRFGATKVEHEPWSDLLSST